MKEKLIILIIGLVIGYFSQQVYFGIKYRNYTYSDGIELNLPRDNSWPYAKSFFIGCEGGRMVFELDNWPNEDFSKLDKEVSKLKTGKK